MLLILSNDIDSLLRAAQIGFFKIPSVFNGARAIPRPGIQLAEPELQTNAVSRVSTVLCRLFANTLTASTIASWVRRSRGRVPLDRT